MPDIDEVKAKEVLAQLISEAGATFTVDDVFRKVRRPKDLLVVIKEITKNQPAATKPLETLRENFDKKEPLENLLVFLNSFAKIKEMSSPPKVSGRISNVSTSTPRLSSTLVADDLTHQLSEIKDKVLQAASAGLSKSAQSTSVSGLYTNGPVTLALSPNNSRNLWNFNKVDSIGHNISHVAGLPISAQEQEILSEVLYCLIGMRGQYIQPKEVIGFKALEFNVSDEIHSSLRDVVLQILPLASHYSIVQRFIEYSSASNRGQVLQSLSAAVRALLNDYYMSIVQLESEQMKGQLSLHKLFFFIRPTLSSMEVLASILIKISETEMFGGQVLSILYDKITGLTGDSNSQKILIHLTQMCSIPYMEILELWIMKGVINDPNQEFLVEDNELIQRENYPEHYSAGYWEKRYTIRQDKVPNFLSNVEDVILRTGKYLNVIRQCGKNVNVAQTEKLEFNPLNHDHINFITNAYTFASKTLLDVLVKENDLMGHLASVKRYFLLFQGDFIAQFMDACEDELSKNVDKVLPMKLDNLLGLTLRLSSANHDPYKDDLHCELLPYDLPTQMSKIIENQEEYWEVNEGIDLTGLECFAFRYEVQWPVSLVLNHFAIYKYQILFRQLFYCKHVERQLSIVWKENSNAKKSAPETAELYRSAFALRQRMMNAIQNIEYYMMIEVIEPNWHIFTEKMSRVENVDDVLFIHQDFLDLCLKNCMLTDANLLRSIMKMCHICLRFCEFIQKSQRVFIDAEKSAMQLEDFSDSESENCPQSESSICPSETFSEQVKRFDLEFTGLLLGLLQQINDIAFEQQMDKFLNLVHRINFNSFYNDQMEMLCAKKSMLNIR